PLLDTHPATTAIYTFPYTTLFRSLMEGIGFLFAVSHQLRSVGGAATLHRALRTRFGFVQLQLAVGSLLQQRRQVIQARNKPGALDRKSTRLNSSHVKISYAVFCLK